MPPLKQWSPTFLASGTSFVEDDFSTDQGWGVVWGWFKFITFTVHFISIITTSTPPQCEDRRRRWTPTSSGDSLRRSQRCRHLGLRCLASRLWENRFLLFKPPNLVYSVKQPYQTNTAGWITSPFLHKIQDRKDKWISFCYSLVNKQLPRYISSQWPRQEARDFYPHGTSQNIACKSA